MDVTGPGVFLLDPDVKQAMPCHPTRELMEAIPGSLGNPLKEEAIFYVLDISDRYNAWCGVVWYRLAKHEMAANLCGDEKRKLIRGAINVLASEGLLRITKFVYKGPRRFLGELRDYILNWLFSPEVICPTPKLVRQIMAS
jgi:hypothetical protein